MDLFRKTMKPVEQVLKDAIVKEDAINDVRRLSRLDVRSLTVSSQIVLVGGCTRIPKVQ